MNITTAITQIKLMIQKQGVMLDSDTATLTEAITVAVGDYSRDNPFDTMVNMAGDGTKQYNLPSTFTWKFSNILAVEYPIDNIPRTFIDERWFGKYRNVDGSSPQLLLYRNTPAVGETLRVHYTYYSEDIEDVDTEDIRGVLNLCASYACLYGATKFAQQANDSRSIDFADRGAMADTLMRLAEYFEQKYKDRIFGDQTTHTPMSKVENLDTYFERRHRRVFNRDEET